MLFLGFLIRVSYLKQNHQSAFAAFNNNLLCFTALTQSLLPESSQIWFLSQFFLDKCYGLGYQPLARERGRHPYFQKKMSTRKGSFHTIFLQAIFLPSRSLLYFAKHPEGGDTVEEVLWLSLN